MRSPLPLSTKPDDDVGDFLPFPVRNPRHPERPITFRHLLTHTSSLDEGEALYGTYTVGDPTVSIEDAVKRYFTSSRRSRRPDCYRRHAPGARKRYSNAGYALLGYLVERISRQPLEEYLQQNVYRILEMRETSFRDYERKIRAELVRLLGPWGFDPRRDIEAVTINRWGHHGYIFPYPGFFTDGAVEAAKKPHGRIAFAHTDLDRFSHVMGAIGQAYRAVQDILGS